MDSMDRVIAELNVKHFKKLLEDNLEEPKRQCVFRLLADEEAKLRLIKLRQRGNRHSPTWAQLQKGDAGSRKEES